MDLYDAFIQGAELRRRRGDAEEARALKLQEMEMKRQEMALRAALERRQYMETQIHLEDLKRKYQRESFQEATPELESMRRLGSNYPSPGLSEQISAYGSAGRRMATGGPGATVQPSEAVPFQSALGVQGEPMEGVRDAAAARAMAIAAETKREQEDRTWGQRASLKAQGKQSAYEKEAHDNYKAALRDARKLRSDFSAFKMINGSDKAQQAFGIASEADLDAMIYAKVEQVNAEYLPVFAQMYGMQAAQRMMGMLQREGEGGSPPPRRPQSAAPPAATSDGFQAR